MDENRIKDTINSDEWKRLEQMPEYSDPMVPTSYARIYAMFEVMLTLCRLLPKDDVEAIKNRLKYLLGTMDKANGFSKAPSAAEQLLYSVECEIKTTLKHLDNC